ncbi:hypothetical protein NDU88_005173 [Pleurodeles waltl]|uniref:Uncharacterized protein n=1 Tax=Pleurodeles waltl TaxID=8319 RepID=A0AAV7MC26_PLEWA|nr:hypothetical protein NDU88_005173 [Pleurodeles waltl]
MTERRASTSSGGDHPDHHLRAQWQLLRARGNTNKPEDPEVPGRSPEHEQVRQLLSASPAHGPFKTNGYEIRIMADFSRETNEGRKGFLALRLRMRQLEVKYSLFEPARLWTTKNGASKNFYDPEDVQIYLDRLQSQSMDTTDSDRPLRTPCDN